MQYHESDIKEKSPELRADESETQAAVLVPLSSKQDHVTTIGQYSLLELIADGSSGEVWRAVDGNGASVAIKLLRTELLSNADAVQRFHQEAKVLRRISHPNVVSILDFGETTDGSPYIVMELIEGQTIKSVLETQGVFEPKLAAKIAREMCRALTAAHAETVIHRDLKPSNVIITNKNDARLVDFGIAKAVGYSGETITQLGGVVGTPSYMSPEQCLGVTVDARSDIYSLGCTLFEMLTGAKAFESNNPVEAIAKQLDSDRTNIRTMLRATGAPSSLHSIVLKCLEREPSNRYERVSQLEHDLGAFILGAPLRYAGAQNKGKLFVVAVMALVAVAIALSQFQSHRVIPAQIHPAEVRAFPAEVHPAGPGIEIRNRFTNKPIFFDPSAANLKEAVEDAAAKKISLAKAYLSGADLRHANLCRLNLRGADLTQADLRGCQGDCYLCGADLRHANLDRSKLCSADLNQANLEGCQLNYANLLGANLTQCNLSHADCRNANFSASHLGQAHLDYADLTDANLSGGDLTQTSLRYARCDHATFDDVKMVQTFLNHAQLHKASFVNVTPIQVTAGHAEVGGTGLSVSAGGFLQREEGR
jgi:uncharacterized protein YjbI with pentapeptide repeats